TASGGRFRLGSREIPGELAAFVSTFSRLSNSFGSHFSFLTQPNLKGSTLSIPGNKLTILLRNVRPTPSTVSSEPSSGRTRGKVFCTIASRAQRHNARGAMPYNAALFSIRSRMLSCLRDMRFRPALREYWTQRKETGAIPAVSDCNPYPPQWKQSSTYSGGH